MIKILVDSASDCRKNKELFDDVIPITVTIDEKDYSDGIDLETDTFYHLLTESQNFPKTSQPSPEQFAASFEQAKNDGDEVIYFALSSALSGTFQSAVIAKDMTEYDKIYIIDTKTATHGINFMAGYAAKLAKEGTSATEIVAKSEELKSRIKLFAGVDTLEYLHRGGRLSKTAAAVGELARIKPIITITGEGTVTLAAKSLGKAGAMQQLFKQIGLLKPDPAFPLYTLYSYGEENCAQLESALSEKGYQVAGRLQVGSAIGAHIGPGAYGVLFVAQA